MFPFLTNALLSSTHHSSPHACPSSLVPCFFHFFLFFSTLHSFLSRHAFPLQILFFFFLSSISSQHVTLSSSATFFLSRSFLPISFSHISFSFLVFSVFPSLPFPPFSSPYYSTSIPFFPLPQFPFSFLCSPS